MDTNYIKAQLQRRLHERQLSKVAEWSGVSRYTLSRIIKGGNGSVKTLRLLDDFLRRTESVKTMDKKGEK